MNQNKYRTIKFTNKCNKSINPYKKGYKLGM